MNKAISASLCIIALHFQVKHLVQIFEFEQKNELHAGLN